ncbi:hypothetical protein RND61_15080 [Streptomyces sp. TRM76323]|uniref:Peptidase S74 domain-containing protein n=1 Tax=Streptomyces tamarix TaxID=3078565 RepID=A0ABU3QKW2_9ACTN|nr:hypothetical protein [Streptomyces tamarix]MDT9683387.1 hypothetical protein [Streptomyces tamarix]
MSDYVRKLKGTATLQSSLGREIKDVYKTGSNNYSLIFATVTKVNFVAGTVDVTTVQKYDTLGNAEGTSGELSARVPSPFNGVTDTGFRYGETFPINIGDLVLIGFIDGDSTRPVVINVYKTPDNATALSNTSATTGNPSQGELYNDTMSSFRLYPGQVYDYVSGDGHREVTLSGGSFFKTASGESGDGILNNYGYGYDDLYKTDLVSGDKIKPYSSTASQMLLIHGASTSPNKTAVLFDDDNSLSLSRYVVGEDGRGDVNLKADKSVELRYQNKDWVPDDSKSNSSGVKADDTGVNVWSGDYNLSVGKDGIVKTYKGDVIEDGNVSQADLDALDKKAQGYADSSLDSANQNINNAIAGFQDTTDENYKEVMNAIDEADKKAQQYAKDAESNATVDLSNEVKERQAQIDAVDQKAKGYADEAKQDAMDAASSADGVIRKTIEDTNSELSTTIQQNKVDADGKIETAQTTATQALDGLSTKVEKTDYDQKTDELSTQINATSQTATQSKQDIVDIKNTASQQESKINSIVSDASQTQQTISDIQKTQSSQSDKINQITTDVDGTKQEITDIQKTNDSQDSKMATIQTTVDGMTTDFSDYKKDADGRISVAQTTASNAVDGLKTKVEKTDFDTATGNLTTQINTTTQTANQSKQDIVDIKNTNATQDSKINSITSDATQTKQTISDIQKTQSSQSDKINQITTDVNGTKQTIGDIQTVQGTQTTNITNLTTRANGFDTTIQSMNNQINSLGKINQLFNTEFSPDFAGWSSTGSAITGAVDKYVTSSGSYNGSNAIYIDNNTETSTYYTRHSQLVPVNGVTVISLSWAVNTITLKNYAHLFVKFIDSTGNTTSNMYSWDSTIGGGWVTKTLPNIAVPSGTVQLIIDFETREGSQMYLSQPMMVFSPTVGDYVQGNYNNNARVLKIEARADSITTELSSTTTTANNALSSAATAQTSANTANNNAGKAQSSAATAQTTANNALSSAATAQTTANSASSAAIVATSNAAKAQLTADQATLALSSYKTDADGRITKNTNDIAATAESFSVSISNVQSSAATAQSTANNALSSAATAQTSANTANSNAGKAQTSADTANNAINNLSVGGRNLLLGTSVSITGVGNNSTNGNFDSQGGRYYLAGSKKVSDLYNQYGSSGYLTISFDWVASGSTLSGTFYPQWAGAPYGGLTGAVIKPSSTNSSGHYENSVALSSNGYSTGTATSVQFRQDNLQGNITITNLKLESGNQATDWTPAPEDVQAGIDTAQSGVNTLSQVNLINNSDFSPDLGGWTQNNNGANGNYTTGDYDYSGAVYVLESTTTGMARTNSAPIPINSLSPVSFSFNFYIFTLPSGGSVYSQLTYLDSSYNEINGSGYPGGINLATGNATGKWINRTVNNLSFTPPTNAKYIVFSFDVRGNGTKAGFNRPILVKGTSVGSYVKGDYGMSTTTTLQLTASNFTLGIDSNGNLISGITGNAQSLSLNGATIYLNSKTVIADDFTTRLLSAYDATIGNTLTIGSGGSIQSVLGGKIWDFTPNSGYYLVDNTNPWFQVDQTGTFIMNSLGDLEFNGTITAPDKGKLPDGSTPYAYPTQTTDGSTTVTWTNKLTTTTSLGIQGLRVDQQNYNRPESSGGFVYVTGHGIFTGMDQVNPRGVMTPDGNLYVDTVNLNSGYSWKTTQVPTAVSKIWQGVYNGTANMYLDAAGYVRIANAAGNSGGKIYVNGDGVQLFSDVSTLVLGIGHSRNGYLYYESKKSGSGGSDVKMAGDGAFFAQTSATKYKTNIQYDTTSTLADRLMTLDLASWNDKGEEDMRVAYKTYGDEPDYAINLDGSRYVGLIAEDLVKANLEEFVVRDPRDGTVESIEYDKIGIALIPAVRQQREMINELRLEIERLKDKIK